MLLGTSIKPDIYHKMIPPDSKIDQFLSNINLPKLQHEQAMALDSPLSIGELHEAHMPSNKAPGPDGFPAEFYKEFWTVLAPTFHKMVLQVKENGRLSPYMNSANIILQQKRDPVLPSSSNKCRPQNNL